jgi:hypothetical protein
MEKLIEMGTRLGLEGKDLLEFISEQQSSQREERQREREDRQRDSEQKKN